jgi:membrane protease YdiL (CAAX protease family)
LRVSYLRELWGDIRRTLVAPVELTVVILVAVFALAVTYGGTYHALWRNVHIAQQWRSLLETEGRALVFLILPLVSLAVLRIPLREVGFAWGEPKRWLVDVGLLYAFMLPLVFFASRQPAFRSYYPYLDIARRGWQYFLLAQTIQFCTMFCWEFICRGYLLFGLHRRLGPVAVAIQTIPFVLLHIGKPELELLGSIIAGMALGVVALRARSFYPCVVLHFAVAATLDLLSVLKL